MTDETTARLFLPLLAAGQAQKEMTHNEALTILDLLVQAAAERMDAEIPPEDPAPGQLWILGNDPVGDWAGNAHAVAAWTEGGWRFCPAREGMALWLSDNEVLARFRDGGWVAGRLDGTVFVDGVRVVGPQQSAIADPSPGSVEDSQARAVISAILAVLRTHGLISV